MRVLVLSSIRRKTAIIFFSLLVDGLKATVQPLLVLLRLALRDRDLDRDFIYFKTLKIQLQKAHHPMTPGKLLNYQKLGPSNLCAFQMHNSLSACATPT